MRPPASQRSHPARLKANSPNQRGVLLVEAVLSAVVIAVGLTFITRALGSNEKDDKAIEEAFKMLRGFKQHVRNFFSDPVQANQLIERGDIAVAPQFGLRIANLVKSNADVVRMTPKEGAPAFPYDLCIPKNSPNVALAKRYIDFAISKPVQESLAQNLLATSVRSDVAVPESLRKFMIADPKQLFFPDEQYVSTKQRDWLERWQREIQS